MAHTKNSIIINAPYDKVFDISNDIERWPELFDEYTDARIISREGNKITFQLTNKKGQTWRSSRVLDKDCYSCAAVREEPKFPFKYMKLLWTYDVKEEGVEMTWEQDFEMDDEAPVGNEKAVEMINEHSKANMAAMKKVIEKEAV